MNVDIAMGVIDETARRLGVPAEQIIPELSRMNIAHNIFMCAVMLTVFLILLVSIIVCVKKIDYFPEVSIFLTGFACLAVAAAVRYGYDLVGWIASPTAKATVYIMGLMK